MDRKLEIKRKMHESVDIALSSLLEWTVDNPKENLSFNQIFYDVMDLFKC